MAVDTNATKFLTLSIVNVFGFSLLLLNRKTTIVSHSLYRILDTNIGLVYLGFLVFSVLSFTQSINIIESYLQFSKIFSVFTAVWILGYIFMKIPILLRYTAVIMIGLLIFDSISVYYYIGQYIDGKIANISDIKTVYSNKNILASSIYVKLPFALWLLLFDRGGLRILSWLALTFGVLATFFLSSRSFFVGLLIITIVVITFSVVNYFRKKDLRHLYFLSAYLSSLLIAFTIFTFVQNVFYPESNSRFNQGVVAQIATIASEDNAIGLRADAWRWSIQMIKENPLMGVGSGNWKIAVLEYENQKNPGFIYMYKAHNDFLENAAEIGILGGLLFLMIFLVAGWNFLSYYKKAADDPDDIYKLLFIAASGFAFYGVDAMFNFPADRPEILLLFSLFAATGIAGAWLKRNEQHDTQEAKWSIKPSHLISGHPTIHYGLGVIVLLIGVGIIYVFQQNFISNKLQRILLQEITAGTLKQPSDIFVKGFPSIPNVGAWGESTSSMIARYLINEKKFQETLDLLKDDRNNPFDSRREYFMALAYNGLGQTDSALYFNRLSYKLKPYHQRNTFMMLSIMEQKNMNDSIPKYLDQYLAAQKTEAGPFVAATNFYIKVNNQKKAYEVIQEAKNYHPTDVNVLQLHQNLYQRLVASNFKDEFAKGAKLYNAQKYSDAVKVFESYTKRVPEDINGHKMLVFSYYNAKSFQKCIDTINELTGKLPPDSELINLRGVAYKELNDTPKACADFKTAVGMGNTFAKTNLDKFCGNR
jgi:O-antigen ligase/tetratricopeptide (TPR) repeat protein